MIAPAEIPIDCQTLPSHRKKFLSSGLKCSWPMKSATGRVSPIDDVDLSASLSEVTELPARRSEPRVPVAIFAASRSGMSDSTRSTAAVMWP